MKELILDTFEEVKNYKFKEIFGWGTAIFFVFYIFGMTRESIAENWFTIFIIFLLYFLIYHLISETNRLKDELKKKEKIIEGLVNESIEADVKRINQLENDKSKVS